MPPPALPVEMYDHILSHLPLPDRHTLHATALVSRLFLALSQPLLFHSVHLSGPAQTDEFLAILEQSPIIWGCVRELCVEDGCLEILGSLGRFTRLESLLHEYECQVWTLDALRNLGEAGTVRRVTMRHCRASLTELCAVMCASPALERFTIEAAIVSFERDRSLPKSALQSQANPSLTSLRIHSIDFPFDSDSHPEEESEKVTAFIPWLLITNSITRHTLTRLNLMIGMPDVDAIGSLFRAVAETLEDLELTCYRDLGTIENDFADEHIRQRLTLSPMSSLKTLLIRHGTFFLVSTLLSSITSRKIHTVTLQTRMRSIDSLGHAGHVQLNRFFRGGRAGEWFVDVELK
ncbi:hypothetical protein K474DRAFT_1705569 [Panus rudis PR-1116 ss-1]|nr:hypothetical protein K474DRAFT_1705569 [Panus rudis PR-1116 ss-1]